MKITKHKGEVVGEWVVRVDGNDTDLVIVKGDDKRWGDIQKWHLFNGDDLVMTQRRAGDIIPTIERLLGALGVISPTTTQAATARREGKQ